MKLGIFTDSHYSSQELTCGKRYNSRSLEKIAAALAHFRNAGCNLVLCLGDLIDREDSHALEMQNLRAVAAVLDGTEGPVLVLRGNHDGFCFTEEEFYGILGESHRPRDLTLGNQTFLFLDACFTSDGNPYHPEGNHDWTDTWLPDTEALRARLAAVPGKAVVCLHQNIDPNIREDHRLKNAAEVRKILEQSGRVHLVLQGHYHPGTENTHNGIRYTTFPAMCEGDGNVYIIEL